MKKSFILFSFLVFFFAHSFAQLTFRKSYDYNYDYTGACNLIRTLDGNFVVAGTTRLAGGLLGSTIAKIDSLGDTLWTKSYGPNLYMWNYSIRQTSDGGFIFCGATNSYGAGLYDVLLIRMDSVGDTLWTKVYGGPLDDYGSHAEQTMDSGFIVTGNTKSFGAGGSDAFLIKTDAMGDISWMKTYGSTLDNIAESVIQTSDSGYVMTGDFTLIKTNAAGDTLWTRRINYVSGSLVRQTSDNGYLVCGPGIHFLKFDSSANLIWHAHYQTVYITFDGVHQHYQTDARSIEQTADGSCVIAGAEGQTDVGYVSFILKTDSNANYQWLHSIGDNFFSIPRESVLPASDGGYFFYSSDHSLYKTNSNGVYYCNPVSGTGYSYVEQGMVTSTLLYVSCAVADANFATSNAPLTVTDSTSFVTYCFQQTVGIQNPEENLQINIFPNPAGHSFTVQLPEESIASYAKLAIVDVTGREVCDQNLISRSTVINHQLSPGIYFVKVKAGGREYTHKLVVE
jgi:hypothetical protein